MGAQGREVEGGQAAAVAHVTAATCAHAAMPFKQPATYGGAAATLKQLQDLQIHRCASTIPLCIFKGEAEKQSS
jgi:hypothetical protein